MITTIIVGNGLGMALDQEYFKLETGLNAVSNSLSEKETSIICFNQKWIPQSENELEEHHKILSACRELIKNKNLLDCLNDVGKEFPNIYQNFIYKVAKYFYDYNVSPSHEIFNSFIKNLIDYIKKITRCHIATLNYDKLIYQPLINNNILKGYDGYLVDGINKYSSGFNPENMIPLYDHNFGWYIHLHGSPVFQTQQNGSINKCSPNDMPEKFFINGVEHNHIVLANTKLKPSIIANSRLLDYYFNFFVEALAESNKLILFGYSGCDAHINFEIKKRLSKVHNPITVQVIQWSGASDKNKEYWENKLYPVNYKNELKLTEIDNILEYNFNNFDF